jgi:hypothetical protein
MSNIYKLPRFIALCGHPKSGKSLAQEILLTHYGVTPVDDGFVLRDLAMRHFGAKPDDVNTQEGKAKLAYWPDGAPIIDARTGEHMTWRIVLGRAGEMLETLMGEFVMPMTAAAGLVGPGPFSFGSVRKTQGHYFQQRGGLIIGINNPQAKPTGNAFDLFDESAVTVWIENDGLARGLAPEDARKDLEAKIHQLVIDYSWAQAAA